MKTTLKPKGRAKLRRSLVLPAYPRRALSHREWAEKYVRTGSGPYAGERFRVARQPVLGLLFDEFDSGSWSEIVAGAPSQSSKSLGAFVIPTLRDVVELRLDALVGTPEADMMADKWDKDFMPVLNASPELSWLIPKSGPGSKGGRIKDRITLGNGVDIKVMSRGGQDTAKAGFSSPRVRLTEAAGWSKKSEASVEGGPFRQIEARLRAYKRSDKRRCLTIEGTFTVDDELPAMARGDDEDEVLISTRSRIVAPCPHCVAFVSGERQHLVGWQNAESELQAMNEATWTCPACSAPISDDERRVMMQDCRLVHWGQEITPKGEVVGPAPPTTRLFFAWGSFHNLLLDASDLALDEWRAAQVEDGTQEKEDAERALCQFVHGTTFKSTLADHEPLKATNVRKRSDHTLPRNVLPADTVKLTIGVDIGDWTGWWFAIAWRENGVLHVPAYGAFDIKRSKNDDLSTRILAALDQFADEVVEVGFPQEGQSGLSLPDEVWIDGGYMPDDVATFVRSRGRFWANRYKFCRGRGRSTNNGGYTHRTKKTVKTPRIGTQWYCETNYERKIPEITFNADYWKLYVHARLRTTRNQRSGEYSKGALAFFRSDHKNEHAKLSRHLTNEQFQRVWEPGKGLVEKWEKTGENHFLDCAAMACGAGDSVGFRLQEVEDPPEEPTEADSSGGCAATSEPANFYANLLTSL